jgi:xanthine dehydrogenase accessory factor
VAVHLTRMAAQVGFSVTVADDREDFASRERFPDAENVQVQPFDRPAPQIAVDTGTFVAVMTRGHLWDYEVLRWALSTEAAYIGMIGSRRKRDVVFGELRREGFAESDLARVHSPIGLDIGASTPEEIALSVAAELVQVRAGLRGAGKRFEPEESLAKRQGEAPGS